MVLFYTGYAQRILDFSTVGFKRSYTWIHFLAMEASYTSILLMSLHWMSILAVVNAPGTKRRWALIRWAVVVVVNVGTGLVYFCKDLFNYTHPDLFWAYYLSLALTHALVFGLFGCRISLQMNSAVSSFDARRLATRSTQVQRIRRISLWGSLVFAVRGGYLLAYNKYIVTSKSVTLEGSLYAFYAMYFFVDAVGLTALLLLYRPAPPPKENAGLSGQALREVRHW